VVGAANVALGGSNSSFMGICRRPDEARAIAFEMTLEIYDQVR
jgi:hypothetical protein